MKFYFSWMLKNFFRSCFDSLVTNVEFFAEIFYQFYFFFLHFYGGLCSCQGASYADKKSNMVLLTRTRTCPSFSTRSPLSRSTWTVSSRLKLLLTVTQINLEEKLNWIFRPVKFGEFCFAFFIFKSIFVN